MSSFNGMIDSHADMFVKGPVGRYTVSRSCVVWCASRSLCSLAFWGRPLADELLEIATIAVFRAEAGETGAALSLDVDAIAANARGLPREIHRVRALLARRLDATIEDAARELGLSTRSLQRSLGNQGTSFHQELVDIRFATACEMLLTTDLKIAAVGARICISERAVALLFRAKTGLSSLAWRAKQKAIASSESTSRECERRARSRARDHVGHSRCSRRRSGADRRQGPRGRCRSQAGSGSRSPTPKLLGARCDPANPPDARPLDASSRIEGPMAFDKSASLLCAGVRIPPPHG